MRVKFLPSGGGIALRYHRCASVPHASRRDPGRRSHCLNLLPSVVTLVGLALACHSVTRWRLGVPAPLSIASDGERR
jgi:hypothetical protein